MSRRYKINPEYIIPTIWATVIFVAVAALCILVALAISVSVSGKTLTKTNPIVSLERASTVDGSFFLGTGTISEVTYFFFYREIAPNQYVLDQTRTSRTIIEESNDKSPVHIEKTQNCKTFWVVGELCRYSHPQEQINILIVPKGTIIKEFSAHSRSR